MLTKLNDNFFQNVSGGGEIVTLKEYMKVEGVKIERSFSENFLNTFFLTVAAPLVTLGAVGEVYCDQRRRTVGNTIVQIAMCTAPIVALPITLPTGIVLGFCFSSYEEAKKFARSVKNK